MPLFHSKYSYPVQAAVSAIRLADGVADRLHAVQQGLNSLFGGLIAVVDVVEHFLIDAGACLLYTSDAADDL